VTVADRPRESAVCAPPLRRHSWPLGATAEYSLNAHSNVKELAGVAGVTVHLAEHRAIERGLAVVHTAAMARDLVRVRAPVTLLSPERLPADSTLSLVPCGGVHLWQLAKIMGTSVAQLEDTYARWLKRTDERLVAAFDAYDLREASISRARR
jgi:hypothetical protein